MNDNLSTFLAEAAGKKKRAGYWDCGLWLADWYMVATGRPDPVADVRGSHYADRDLPIAARAVTRRLGLPRTRDPKRGDIGLISLVKGHLVGAIFTGRYWCVLVDEHGIAAVSPDKLRFIAAWRIT